MATFTERINKLYDEARNRNYNTGRAAFAEQIGMSLGQLSPWLDGKARPDLETLKRLAINTGVSASWLIGETDYRNLILPDTADSLPTEAQKEYRFFINCIKAKYNLSDG